MKSSLNCCSVFLLINTQIFINFLIKDFFMIDAFYTVSFVSSFGISGAGVAVLKDGKVFGGDSRMVYAGQYSIESGTAIATLAVSRHFGDAELVSVVGLDNFRLSAQGPIKDFDAFTLHGIVVEDPNRTITITFKKYSNL